MPFLDLPDRLREVRDRIDAAAKRGGRDGRAVRIVAVTKTHGPDALQAAWDAGLQDVGENKVQEALGKMDALPLPFRWHLIGHLQRNKVKHLARFHLIHSLDRPALADAVATHAADERRVVDCLVQVNIVGEETKGGYEPRTLDAEADRLKALPSLRLRGVMTMAPFDAADAVLRRVFRGARESLATLRRAGHTEASELSMGMSQDYETAVEEGATIVRIGTVLFGARS
jgi:PLP dependent protein